MKEKQGREAGAEERKGGQRNIKDTHKSDQVPSFWEIASKRTLQDET